MGSVSDPVVRKASWERWHLSEHLNKAKQRAKKRHGTESFQIEKQEEGEMGVSLENYTSFRAVILSWR